MESTRGKNPNRLSPGRRRCRNCDDWSPRKHLSGGRETNSYSTISAAGALPARMNAGEERGSSACSLRLNVKMKRADTDSNWGAGRRDASRRRCPRFPSDGAKQCFFGKRSVRLQDQLNCFSEIGSGFFKGIALRIRSPGNSSTNAIYPSEPSGRLQSIALS